MNCNAILKSTERVADVLQWLDLCLTSSFEAFSAISFICGFTLLLSPPYSYSSAVIGLFGLISILLICVCPVYTRYVINKMDPLVSVLSSLLVELAGVTFGAFTGEPTVAGPVVQAVVIDFSTRRPTSHSGTSFTP